MHTDLYNVIEDTAKKVGATVEANRQYHRADRPHIEYRSEEVSGDIPATVRGTNNVIWRGMGSKAPGSSISINGDNNQVFLGAFTRFRKVDLRLRGNNCVFFFGALSSIASGLLTVSSGKTIAVGEDCLFSSAVTMDVSDHHGIYDAVTGERLNHPADILIHPNVWFGRNVTVSKGAVINSNSVVGQSSLVVGAVDAGSVYAGVPAKLIRSGIKWSYASEAAYGDVGKSTVVRTLKEYRRRYSERLSHG